MSRIRSIHPKILTDEAFMMLTVESPLSIALLLGIWIEADDSGTFEWKPLTLKARILPAAAANILDLLSALEAGNFVKRFEINSKSYGVVRNFVRYQRPKKPLDTLPFTSETRSYAGFIDGKRPHAETGRASSDDCHDDVTNPGGTIRGSSDASSEPVPNSGGTGSELSRQRKEEGGRREEGSEEERKPPSGVKETQNCELTLGDATPITAIADPPPAAPATDPPPHRPASARKSANGNGNGHDCGARIPPDFRPDERGAKLALKLLGKDAANREIANFKDFWAAKPGAAGLKLDWQATWRVWIRNTASKGNRSTGPPARRDDPYTGEF